MPYINAKLTAVAIATALAAPQAAGALSIPALPNEADALKSAVQQDIGGVQQTVEEHAAPATRAAAEQIASRTVEQTSQSVSQVQAQARAQVDRSVAQAKDVVAESATSAARTVSRARSTVRETGERSLSAAERGVTEARRDVAIVRSRAQRRAMGAATDTLELAHELGEQLSALLAGGTIRIPHWVNGGGEVAWTNSDGCLSLQLQGSQTTSSFRTGC